MNPANVSSSGGLVRGSSRDGIAISTGPGLRPGGVLRSEVTIVNLGVLPAVFHLTEANASSDFARGILGLAIRELRSDGDRSVYMGEIGTLPGDGIDLGRFERGESRTYRFTVLVAKDAPEDKLGGSAAAAYRWTAVPS